MNVPREFTNFTFIISFFGISHVFSTSLTNGILAWMECSESLTFVELNYACTVVFSLDADVGHGERKFWRLCIYILCGAQGLCVATLFCFFNGEVIAQVKRKWRTIFFSSRPRSNSYTATQVSVSTDSDSNLWIRSVLKCARVPRPSSARTVVRVEGDNI